MQTIPWSHPWQAVTAAVAAHLEMELQRELAPGHQLFGRRLKAVGARCDCDDVLFEFPDSPQVAVVHLTYARPSDRPPWPSSELFQNLSEFVEKRMMVDHQDHTDGDETL